MLKMVVDKNKEELLKIEDVLRKQQSRLEVYKKLRDRTGLKHFPVLPRFDNSTNHHKLTRLTKSYKQINKLTQSDHQSITSISSRYNTREVLLDFSKNSDINFDLKEEFASRKLINRDDELQDGSLISPSIHLIQEDSSLENNSNFLPGDCLIEVNGRNVKNMTTSQILELISRCKAEHHKVILKVRPLPELTELSVRTGVDGSEISISDLSVRSGTLRRSDSLRMRSAKMEVKQGSKQLDFSNFEVVWIKHREGFTSAIVVGRSSTDKNKIKVRLDQGQVEMEVDQSDVEEANPAAYDRIEDLSFLRCINESSCIHTLRHRYHSNLTHTFAGESLVVINPKLKLCIYSEKVMSMFKGCNAEDTIPHIYATAQASYFAVLSTRTDQAVLLMGPSGAGKTTNLYHLLHYYIVIASSISSSSSSSSLGITGDHLKATRTVFESFGNCRTTLNDDASRFVQVTKTSFDYMGRLTGITFQVLNLERNRLSWRPEGEPTFHVFYHMLAGIDAKKRKELYLDRIHDPNVLMTPLHKPHDQQTARVAWAKIIFSMANLGFGRQEVDSILLILASIFHIGSAGVIRGENGRGFQFARPVAGNKAANLLGCTLQDLSSAIFGKNQSVERNEADSTGLDLIGQFVGELYFHVFMFVVSLINRRLSPSPTSTPFASILIVDPPGFQNPQLCGRQEGADLYDFECNYVNERFELFCRESLVTKKLRLYKEELNESFPVDDVLSRNMLIELLLALDGIEMKSNSKSIITKNQKSSVFKVLENASTYSTSQFLKIINEIVPTSKTFTKSSAESSPKPPSPSLSSPIITINHLYETTHVQYNVLGWLKQIQQTSLTDRIHSSLIRSSSQAIRNTCFMEQTNVINFPSSSSSAPASPSLSSSSSPSSKPFERKISRTSILLHSTDALLKELERRETRFVFCWQPHLDSKSKEDNRMLTQHLRSQWRSTCLIHSTKLHRDSYPEHYTYSEFATRFAILRIAEDDIANGLEDECVDEKRMTEIILKHQKVDPSTYKFGKTQIFFRSAALTSLNITRDDVTNKWIVTLQSFCKGMLARRRSCKLKVTTEAIRYIQEASRDHMELKKWKWWRLFEKVRKIANACNHDNRGTMSLGSPFTNESSRFEEETNTGDIIDPIIGDYNLKNGEDYDSHQNETQEILDDVKNHKLLFVNVKKDLKSKNEHIRQVNGLIEEKMKENEEIRARLRRMERDVVNKEEMLKFEIQEKEQLLQEVRKLGQDKLVTKQQLEDALYDFERETGRRRDAEMKFNLYCGANDEYERIKLQNEDLSKDKKKYLQRLENQETTIKKLIETISKLEETNHQLKQTINRMERKKEEEMDGKTASSLKEIQSIEEKMKELLKERDDQLRLTMLNEDRLKDSLSNCRAHSKLKQRKLKQKVKKLSELLRVDQSKKETPNQLIKMLRAKLEDLEDELEVTKRLKRGMDGEVTIVQGQLTSILESKKEMVDRMKVVLQTNTDMSSQLEDREDEYNELMKKYSNLVHQNSLNLEAMKEQSRELESLRVKFQQQAEDLQVVESKLSRIETSSVSNHLVTRMEAKMAEMKTSMEMDSFARKQAESHLSRLKEVVQKEKSDKMNLQELLQKREEEMTSQRSALKVQKSRVICLEARLQDLEGLITQLRRKIDEQHDDCKEHKEEIDLLKRRIIAIQSNASMFWVNDDDDNEDDNDIHNILAKGKVMLLSPRKSLLDSSDA